MENKQFELTNTLWKQWANSFSVLSSTGKQMEQITLNTMKQQQEAWNKMAESMDMIEQEMTQHFSQMTSQYADYVKQIAGNQLGAQIDEWQHKWNELTSQLQQVTTAPVKSSFSVLSQTSAQLEETMKQFSVQSQLHREDVQKQMESFLQEVQAVQTDLTKKFEEHTKNLFTPIK
ncbi:polyhydroxyalkanoic acid inclusion protein PhaP [Bacillus sp. 165]|uniref:polyhydroxyalkanoic acid inclusion protein PhaP n=1 Tax=Bacillus sp. 165 TaxID=1529117 RepID=UPI001ADD15B3|nr:polyhydroxyalkanoic acid inclusion protein PhaP [Bacillus sp. 165]MBO9128462.1 polyhydroxyalkanoic acid inclusion protein PhaP [Bacillus sp. 165]